MDRDTKILVLSALGLLVLEEERCRRKREARGAFPNLCRELEMDEPEKELRKKFPPSGSSRRRLQFLEPHTRRESTSNLAHKEPTAPTDTSRPTGACADGRFDGQRQEEIETEEDQTLPHYTLPMAESSPTGPPAKRRRSLQTNDEAETSQGLMRLIGAALRKMTEERPPEDAFTVSLKVIERMFRKAPAHLVDRLEHDIINLIYDVCGEQELDP